MAQDTNSVVGEKPIIIDLTTAHIVSTIRDKNEYKKLAKTRVIIYTPSDKATSEDIRRMLKNRLCDYIAHIEYAQKGDKMHMKNIRIHNHHILLCKENNISIVIDCSKLLSLSKKEFQQAATRIHAIAKMTQKHKVKLNAISLNPKSKKQKENQNDLQSLIDMICNPPNYLLKHL